MADQKETGRGLRFDPTITAGQVGSTLATIVIVTLAWSSFGTRLTVLEEQRSAAVTSQTMEKAEAKEAIREIKADVKEVQRTLNDLTRNIATNRK